MAFVTCVPIPRQAYGQLRRCASCKKTCTAPLAILRKRVMARMSDNGEGKPPSSRDDIPYSSSSNPEPENDVTPSDYTVDVASTSLEAEVRDIPLPDLKCEFYAAVSSTNRGLAASPNQKKDIIALIEQIERLNPTSTPSDAPELAGKWRLLYTNSLDILSLGLLAPVALIGQIYQNVYESEVAHEFDIKNIVELEPPFASLTNAFFGRTMAAVEVSAKGKRESEKRIDITFKRSAFQPETLAGVDVSRRLPPFKVNLSNPVGYIDTTFLDKDIRIARAPPTGRQEDNIFVLIRDQLVSA